MKGQTPLGEDQYSALNSQPRLPLLSSTYAAPFLMEIFRQQQQQEEAIFMVANVER